MNIPNDALLATYRKPGLCEVCRKPCRMRCAAHIFSKGAGRVDHPWNLVQVGMDTLRDCKCHHNSHANNSPSRLDLLRIVERREGVAIAFIQAVIPAIRACPRLGSIGNVATWLTKAFREEVAVAALGIIRESGIYKESADA